MRKHGNPELAHISREQIEQFSSRGKAEIEAALAAQGLTLETASATQKKAAVMATREAKQDYDREELTRQWQARAKAAGLAASLPRPAPHHQHESRHQQHEQQSRAGKTKRRSLARILSAESAHARPPWTSP